MNEFLKVVIVVLMVLYIVSPVDTAPGPIDDIVVLFMGLAVRKGLSIREE